MSEIKSAPATNPFCVAIDYDDTFDTCPETWTKVIEALRAAGARVICVTFRHPNVPVKNFPGEVFYTSGQLKAQFAHENNLYVKVWIDDQPVLIGENPIRQAFFEAIKRAG